MQFASHFNQQWLYKLLNTPSFTLYGQFQHLPYMAKIAIPEYRDRLTAYYVDVVGNQLSSFCEKVEITFNYRHYGIIIHFDRPAELALHDNDGVLDEGLRYLIAQTGPVIMKNAYMTAALRDPGHRNRFPHLNFHIDRSLNQPTQYSFYTRDPFDAEQKYPRTSSTLFVPSIVGHLQAIKEGNESLREQKGLLSTYTIFKNEEQEAIRSQVILEHRWDEAEGTGEISMLDNRTTLHASYYRDHEKLGYKIGVRYLA